MRIFLLALTLTCAVLANHNAGEEGRRTATKDEKIHPTKNINLSILNPLADGEIEKCTVRIRQYPGDDYVSEYEKGATSEVNTRWICNGFRLSNQFGRPIEGEIEIQIKGRKEPYKTKFEFPYENADLYLKASYDTTKGTAALRVDETLTVWRDRCPEGMSDLRKETPKGITDKQRSLITKYCRECHGTVGPTTVGFSAVCWDPKRDFLGTSRKEKPRDTARAILSRLNTKGGRAMPPAGSPQPTAEEMTELTGWIQKVADRPE